MKIVLSVLHINNGKGGAERTATNLANAMVARGHDVLIHSSTRPDLEPAYALSPKVQHLKMSFDDGRAILEVRERLREFDPDVAFLFFFDRFLFWQYASVSGLGVGIGGQECTNPERAVENLVKSKWFGDAEDSTLARDAFLSGLHAVRFTMPSYIDSAPAIARPIVQAFPNAYELAPRPVEQNVTGRKGIISVSGLKSPNKNGAVLARAFAEIAHKFPDWDLHYHGSNRQAGLIADLLADPVLSKRIFVHGFTEDMYAAFAGAHLHVICSLHEGNPNGVCEAMAHGIPTIGFSDCPGTNELVVDGKNGLLISRSEEIANLKLALEKLMGDNELRGALGREAYADASRLFSPNDIFDRWERLLLGIAQYKNKTRGLFARQRKIDPVQEQHLGSIRRAYYRHAISAAGAEESVQGGKLIPLAREILADLESAGGGPEHWARSSLNEPASAQT